MEATPRLFAVIVTSDEARAFDATLFTESGTKFIVTECHSGWVEASSQKFTGKFPGDTKTFESFELADEFAKRWKGQPWWCKPSGMYEIVEVVQKYKQVPDGYDLVS